MEEVKEKEKKECNKNCKCEHNEHSKHDDKCHCKEKKKDTHGKEKKLKEEIERLKKENIEAIEKVKYAQAELINYRKRKDEEVSNYKKFCNQDLIMELIPVVDNFERAIKLDDNDLTDELSKFLDGFKMMYAMLSEALRKFGVEEINNAGKPFNSNEEEALMTDNIPDMEDDVVTEVLLKGYKLNGRVIRPASVKVNKKCEGEMNNE